MSNSFRGKESCKTHGVVHQPVVVLKQEVSTPGAREMIAHWVRVLAVHVHWVWVTAPMWIARHGHTCLESQHRGAEPGQPVHPKWWTPDSVRDPISEWWSRTSGIPVWLLYIQAHAPAHTCECNSNSRSPKCEDRLWGSRGHRDAYPMCIKAVLPSMKPPPWMEKVSLPSWASRSHVGAQPWPLEQPRMGRSAPF